jgi:hypothetical protein
MTGTAAAKTWDTEWAAKKAAEALRYLGRNIPEGLENPRVLDEHEEAANAAAMRGDREGYQSGGRLRPSRPPIRCAWP